MMMDAAVKNVGRDLIQPVMMKAIELASKKSAAYIGTPLTQEQRNFLVEIISNLTDSVITAIRTGKLKPEDVASGIVSEALATSGFTEDDSKAIAYADIVLALISLALSTTELSGAIGTAAVAAGLTAPETGGVSLAADFGFTVIGLMYLSYQVIDTVTRCASDWQKIEQSVPSIHNVGAKRQAYMNLATSRLC